jgi:hypothetical protein
MPLKVKFFVWMCFKGCIQVTGDLKKIRVGLGNLGVNCVVNLKLLNT